MSDNNQKINTFFGKFDARFNAKVPAVIAETAVEFFKQTFISKSWDGNPWPVYNIKGNPKQKEPTRGSLMLRTLALFDSIQPSETSATKVTISAGGAKAPYARVHNEGLRVAGVRQVKAFTNKNFMGKGKAVPIKAHSRTVNYQMPKRQFIGKSTFLNTAIRAALLAEWKLKNK